MLKTELDKFANSKFCNELRDLGFEVRVVSNPIGLLIQKEGRGMLMSISLIKRFNRKGLIEHIKRELNIENTNNKYINK